jgi:hypothetical protein
MGRARELAAAARRWRHVRRVGAAPDVDRAGFRSGFEQLLAGVRDATVAFVDVPSDRPPWLDTGIDLAPGEEVTWFACGRTYLSRPLDVWVGPQFQLWARVGESGTIFNGTRASHTFAPAEGGRLFLASYFPGQWGDAQGRVATDLGAYRSASGGLCVVLIRWRGGAEAGLEALVRAAERAGASDLAANVAAEAARHAQPPASPRGWRPLWFLGHADIFRSDAGCIHCRTLENVEILQIDAPRALTPETTLDWEWKVDALPSSEAEDALLSHDYMSIAVEFNDGRDITYYWSGALPEGTGFWCPLPGWRDREFHVAIRSGAAGLGAWHAERRNLHRDYAHYIGEPPARVVRVWLIAVSLFQRQPGACTYRRIRLGDAAGGDELVPT